MKITDDMLYRYASEARGLWLYYALPDDQKIPDHRFSTRFNRKMKKLLAQQRRSSRMNRIVFYVRRAVAAFLIIISVAFAGIMTVEAYREQLIETIVRVFNELTDYRFSSETPHEEATLSGVNFGYIPDGMHETMQNNRTYTRYVLYESEDGSFFELDQSVISANSSEHLILDTEDAVVEEWILNGATVTEVIKNGEITLLWVHDSNRFLLSGNLSADEIRAVARGIINN